LYLEGDTSTPPTDKFDLGDLGDRGAPPQPLTSTSFCNGATFDAVTVLRYPGWLEDLKVAGLVAGALRGLAD
jgi:hypothetical protein